jgi:DNA modification methylase
MSELLTVICGDALEKLRELPDESVQCCVTSPPYWGLRDYKTPPKIWLRDLNHDICRGEHNWEEHIQPAANGITHDGGMTGETLSGSSATRKPKRSQFCKSCGAWEGSFGLEPTPELFVEHLSQIFRETRRVLRKDGTLWLNLGDSYNAYNGGAGPSSSLSQGAQTTERPQLETGYGLRNKSIKPKDLIGIPWMVAFALRQDGWYLRSDIIWSKPNPMPESVTDRPTKAHEYLFLLSKSRKYFYDAEAIKEDVTGNAHARGDGVNPKAKWKTPDGWDTSSGNGSHGNFHRNGREEGFIGYKTKQTGRNSRQCVDQDPTHLQAKRPKQNESFSGAVNELVDARNKRSVWNVATAPYPDAHFATYPPDLIKPCILAGCPVGGTVLDPFAGSGITGMVALELGRKAMLIELNPDYVKLIHQRCNVTPGLALA